LFENLAKYTEEDTEELVSVLRAVERSKEILNNVNQAVREAEDIQRLTEIQRRLDKSGFEKVEHPMAGEFKVCGNLLFSCVTKVIVKLNSEGMISINLSDREQ
jgi:hypothetical protein